MRQSLRVLVACECSGRVRDEFAKRGWEAWSADLLPSEVPPHSRLSEDWEHDGTAQHYQGDARDLFNWNHRINENRSRYERYTHVDRPAPPLWDLVIAHPPCFTAGTPVVTARGIVAIETVKRGDLVLTHRGRWRTVMKTMNREATTVTDGQITATPDHPFWTRDTEPRRYGPRTPAGGGNPLPFELGLPRWTPAATTQGKYLGLPSVIEPTPMPVHPGDETQAFWYMVGRWLGDGWTRVEDNAQHPHYDTLICCAPKETLDLAERLVETGFCWNSSQERTVTRFTLSHKELAPWLEANFGKYAHGKTLPAWLFGMPERIRTSFLHGYLEADGCRSHTASPGTVSVSSTVSRNLAVGIRILATTLGYTTTLTKNKRAGKAVIEGRTINQRDSWTVVIRKDDGRFTRLGEGHRWVKQRRPWQASGVQTVYDITVAEDHSFVAHGFVVHNCTDLSYAGARWFKDKDQRRGGDGRMQCAMSFFKGMYAAPSPLVAVENPHSVMQEWKKPDQVVQPWMFGDPYSKGIHLWLRKLPPLKQTHYEKDYPFLLRAATGGGSWRTDKAAERARMSAYEDSEGRANRAKVRSRTFPGIAKAMAQQWGDFAVEYYRD